MHRTAKLLTPLFVSGILCLSGANAGNYNGKKVLYIDSYHAGYEWSDGITNGVQNTLAKTGVELKIIRMDTKRNKGEAFMQEAAQKAKSEIDSFKPDVVIASDDNASKFVIQPFYKDASLPFVFCGVNWDETVYGYPYKNVTGMVEVSGVKELVDLLKQFSKGERIGLLAEDTLTEHKEAENYKAKLGIDVQGTFVNSFAEWKQKYDELQDQVDILIIGNTAGLSDFDAKAAEAHVQQHARIPSGAIQINTMPYAMIGYLKVAEEQGTWAANTALQIMDGKSPAEIPVTRNKEGNVVINLKLAEATGVEIPYTLIESATTVME